MFYLSAYDGDEKWSTSDADSLAFSIELPSGEPRPADGDVPPMPKDFSVLFDSELKWINQDRLPRFSDVPALK